MGVRPSTLKARVDLDAVRQNRRVLGQQPARQAAEARPRRRRTSEAQAAIDSFRDFLGGGR